MCQDPQGRETYCRYGSRHLVPDDSQGQSGRDMPRPVGAPRMAANSGELGSAATARMNAERASDGLLRAECDADLGPASADSSGGRDADMPIKAGLPSPTMHAATTALWDSTQTDSAATSSPVTAAASRVQSVRHATINFSLVTSCCG